MDREEGKDGRVMNVEEGKDVRVWTEKREGLQSMYGEEGSMAELAKREKGWQNVEREEGKDGRVGEKSERMAELAKRVKGWQSVDGEEGKDDSMWQWLKERMAERGRGRGKGWQHVAVAEGKDGRARAGKRERRMAERRWGKMKG